MENVPAQAQPLSPLSPTKSSRKVSEPPSAFKITRTTARALSPLNLGPSKADPFVAQQTTSSSQPQGAHFTLNPVPQGIPISHTPPSDATIHTLLSESSSSTLASSTPSFDSIMASVRNESPPPTSTRKRTRQSQAQSATANGPVNESPNPKARKQPRVLRPRDTAPAVEDSSDNEPPEHEPASGSARASTPARGRKKAAVPKTETVARVKKATGSAAGRSRRKSAPGTGSKARKAAALPLETVIEPESDNEDPILLVGEGQWVPVPWKPLPNASGTVTVKKEEEEDPVPQALTSAPTAAAEISHNEVGGEEEAQVPDGPPTSETPPQSPVAPLPTTIRTASPPLFEGDGDHSFYDPPEADSSFVGMQIDSDKDVDDFAVPLRTESPPSRKRRSSAVSQREETPGDGLSPGKTTPPPRERSKTPLRLPEVRATPRPLRIDPVTPFTNKHKSILSQTPKSPAAYPSPRFRGTRLGSLSPEKGRGPSRGHIPKLPSPIPAEELDLSVEEPSRSLSYEREDASGSVPTALPDFVTFASGVLQNSGQGDQDISVDDFDRAEDLEGADRSGQVDDEDAEEEFENSMRVERELTEVLSDDDMVLDRPVGSTVNTPMKDESFELLMESPKSRSDPTLRDVLGPVAEESLPSSTEETPLQPAHRLALLEQHDMEETDASTSDDDEEPRVEISSKDPMVAARAAAILKYHHDYVEEEARKRLRKRRSSASIDVNDTPVQHRGAAGSRSTPIPRKVLLQAEQEVVNSPPTRRKVPSRLAEAEAFLAEGNPSTPPGANVPAYFTPPGQKIPAIVIDPASVRPTDKFLNLRGYDADEDRPWTRAEWKRLEQCLLTKRKVLSDARGRLVDVGDVDAHAVVKTFMDQERLIGDPEDWEGEGEWSRDKIHRRVIALQVRHSRQPAGSIEVPGSPMVVPFTPLPSRQTTPVSLETTSTTARTAPQRSISPAVPLPPSLMSRRYSHLYEEASAMAGFGIAPTPDNRPTSQSPAPIPPPPQRAPSIPRLGSSSKLPKPNPAKKTEMLPPPPPSAPIATASAEDPVPAHKTPSPNPVPDTPSAASRVLNFLGLSTAQRNSKKPPIPAAFQRRRVPSPTPTPEPPESSSTPQLKKAVPTSPVAKVMQQSNRSKDDLNHIEPTPARLPERAPHPKDLVKLTPVPPKTSAITIKPRRSSGSSVKDLVASFESLEGQKESGRDRIRGIIQTGRRAVSSIPSLRRTPSSLSIGSVVGAEVYERDAMSLDGSRPATPSSGVPMTPAQRYAASISSTSSTASKRPWR